MTLNEVLVPGAIAILSVVTWFVLGLVDATREHRPGPDTDAPGRTPVRSKAPRHR
jgi:hypothetical protein